METSLDTGDPLSCTLLLVNATNLAQLTSVLSISLTFALMILLFLSAIVSGAEVAFFSLTSDDRSRLREGDERERKVAFLLDTPRHLLATMLAGNYLFNLLFIILAFYLNWYLVHAAELPDALLVSLIVALTFALVFFGELIPKVYARNKNQSFAKFSAPLVAVLSTLLRPLTWLLINLTQWVEERAQKKGYRISLDELNNALEVTTGEDTTKEEKEILKGIVNFGNISAKQIMRSRVDITAFDVELDFHELMDKINKFGYSRVPVYRETIDKIEGILYIKDLLPFINRDEYFAWQKLLRPGYFIPENKKIDDLLYDFQEKRVHMAIVVDEYGGTSGLITLEDIIEEIVGEINDEFDEDNRPYSQLDAHTYLFEGKISLNDFCKVLDIDAGTFDKVRGDSESLGGLLLELFSKLPRAGEHISYGDFDFHIVAVDVKKIKKVKVKVRQSEKSATQQ